MKFSGKRVNGLRKYHNEFFVNNCRMPLCQGVLYEKVGCVRIDQYTKGDHSYDWGYDGTDPQLMAITLMAISLGAPNDDAYGKRTLAAFCDWYGNGLGDYEEKKLPTRKGWFSTIKDLYKQFTSEVVANFGDTWEITSEEILQWIKEKESQRESSVVK